jgi:arabinogalactan endo-1,4-beta-galactosidase
VIQSKRGTLAGLKRNPAGQSKYDSLLERDYMRELEHEGGVVKWTKEHGIKIPYRIFGIISRNYLPDFLVTFADGSQELHETKGEGFLFWLETHAKRAAADTWCKSRSMKYKFIENSRGAMFANNNALAKTALHSQRSRKVNSLDDL